MEMVHSLAAQISIFAKSKDSPPPNLIVLKVFFSSTDKSPLGLFVCHNNNELLGLLNFYIQSFAHSMKS